MMWLLAMAQVASAPQFAAPKGDSTVFAQSLGTLAQQVAVAYHDDNRARYLDNLFRIQLVAGRYTEAIGSFQSLRDSRAGNPSPQTRAMDVQHGIDAQAAAKQHDGLPADLALRQAFQEVLGPSDDRTQALVIRAILLANQANLQRTASEAVTRSQRQDSIPITDAIALIRAYQVAQAYRHLAPLAEDLAAQDDARRYVIEKDVPVRTPDGATVCALIVRPRAMTGRLPTLLDFTIYADPDANMSEARRTASNGYAGVVGLTRGKGCSPDTPVPYVYDGADAAVLIDWITSQPWSDGRVGMYSGSYDGFTQWAAAKHMPRGLKALMPGAPVAPGLDVPMEGNIVWNFIYPWPFYTTDVKGLDNQTYFDNARWRRLNREWYVRGGAYRDLEQLDGTSNPIFDQWISHPDYDAYWQAMIPYEEDFARIRIPVLATAGYYFGGPGAAVHYFLPAPQIRPGRRALPRDRPLRPRARAPGNGRGLGRLDHLHGRL